MDTTAHPATTYVGTGTNGTTTQPWAGDTYTILSMKGDITGWVVWHSGTWRSVSATCTPDVTLQGAYAILDAMPVAIRRDGHASFHAAWMDVENRWVRR